MENLALLNFSGIYQLLNLVNNKRYIGQAQNIQTRIYEHKRKRNKGYLYKAINKYGWENFNISVLEKVDDISKLDEREQFWLDLLQTYVASNGYNVCKSAGTTRGRKHSDTTKQKIKEAIPDKYGIKNPFYGKKHTEESLSKMSESHKRIKVPKDRGAKILASRIRNGTQTPKKPITQFNLDTKEIVQLWDGIITAAKSGYTLSSLSQCCNNKRKSHKGFGWKFTCI